MLEAKYMVYMKRNNNLEQQVFMIFLSSHLNIIPARICHYPHNKVWDGITDTFPNFDGVAVEASKG